MKTEKEILNNILEKLALINGIIYFIGVIGCGVIYFKSSVDQAYRGFFPIVMIMSAITGSISIAIFFLYKSRKDQRNIYWRIVYILSYIYLFFTWKGILSYCINL